MKTLREFLGEGSLTEENTRLNKKVKAELDQYLGTTKPNSPDYQFVMMHVLKGALVDANFHDEAKKLDKFFPKANESKYATPEFDALLDGMKDRGRDIARAAKWDGHDIIDAFASYTTMTMGRPFGQKLQSLKEEVVNEATSRTAMEIGALTGMNKNAIQTFVDSNEMFKESVVNEAQNEDPKSDVEHLTEGFFYSVSAESDSIRALMKVPNVKREDIKTRMVYGGRYPKKIHYVFIDGFNEQEFGSSAQRMAHELEDSLPKIPRVRYVVNSSN